MENIAGGLHYVNAAGGADSPIQMSYFMGMSETNVLLVDDDALVLQRLSLSLEDEGYNVATATSGKEAIALCHEQTFSVVICDIRMPEMNGIETLSVTKEIHPDMRTIVITGSADDSQTPVQAVRLGVDDYLLKPFDDELLHHSVAQNVERFNLQEDNARLHAELQQANARLRQENTQLRREVAGRYPFADIVGASPAMQVVYQLLHPVIDSDITVLIAGATGTGKDLIARAIHYNGPRRDASFVPVHCGAIQESLLESELFVVIPHYPGLHSPTGKKGLFEEADGGTLFLDEVGEMEPSMQVKLLRVLQDGEIQHVGDTQPRQVDVRVVAATNRNLEQEVEEGRFRQDLYYRLAGIEVQVPPLRQRRGDIPLLAQHFFKAHCAKMQRAALTLDPAVIELLEQYPWPGNVRELQKEIERAATLAAHQAIAPQHFSKRLLESPNPLPAGTGAAIPLHEVERRHIHGVLQETEWNIQQAAALGIHRNTLARKIAEYDLRQSQ